MTRTRTDVGAGREFFLRLLTCGLGMVLWLLAGTMGAPVAWGQEDDEPGAEEPGETGRAYAGVEEIVVEARRRRENMQDVPITLQAVTAETLKDAGVSGIMGISQFSPSLNVTSDVDENGARFFIRGVGTATPLIGVAESAVPVYINDVYTPLGLGANLDLFSIDRVEVLSGPQGTLYGRNSYGGAVKIYSKQFTDQAEFDFTMEGGSFAQRNVKTEIYTPVIQDRLWLGGGFAKIKNDGIQKFIALGNGIRGWEDDKELYNLRLQARPIDELTFNASYSRSDIGGVGRQQKTEDVNLNLRAFTDPAFVDQLESIAPPTSSHPDHIETNVASDSTALFEITTWRANYALTDTIDLIYLGGDHSLENLRVIDNDGTPAPFLQFLQDFAFDAQSHELQLQWNSDRFNFILGAFYYDEDTVTTSSAHNSFFGPVSFIHSQDEDALSVVTDITGRDTAVDAGVWNMGVSETESLAFFANIGANLTDRLRGSIGLRWTRDERFRDSPFENQNFVIDPSITPFSGDIATDISGLPLPGGVNDPNNFGFNFDNFEDGENLPGADAYGVTGPVREVFREATVEATLDYRLTPDILTYGSFRQGFTGGTPFPNAFAQLAEELEGDLGALADIPQATEEQTVNAYELGVKTTLLDGRWQFNAAAFYYDFDDIIISVATDVPTEVVATGVLFVPQNAGKARTIGFDADTIFKVTNNLSIRANVGYFDFRLKEVMQMGTNIADTFQDSVVAGAPKWQGALGIEYFAPMTRYGQPRLWVNGSFRSRMNTFGGDILGGTGFGLIRATDDRDLLVSEAAEDISAGMSLTLPDDRWRIDFTGFNLLDQRRFTSTPVAAPGFWTAHAWNKPRHYLLSFTYSFSGRGLFE